MKKKTKMIMGMCGSRYCPNCPKNSGKFAVDAVAFVYASGTIQSETVLQSLRYGCDEYLPARGKLYVYLAPGENEEILTSDVRNRLLELQNALSSWKGK